MQFDPISYAEIQRLAGEVAGLGGGGAVLDALLDPEVTDASFAAWLGCTGTATLTMTVQPADGDTLTLTDKNGVKVTFEFDSSSSITPGNAVVTIGADVAATRTALEVAINAANFEGIATIQPDNTLNVTELSASFISTTSANIDADVTINQQTPRLVELQSFLQSEENCNMIFATPTALSAMLSNVAAMQAVVERYSAVNSFMKFPAAVRGMAANLRIVDLFFSSSPARQAMYGETIHELKTDLKDHPLVNLMYAPGVHDYLRNTHPAAIEQSANSGLIDHQILVLGANAPTTGTFQMRINGRSGDLYSKDFNSATSLFALANQVGFGSLYLSNQAYNATYLISGIYIIME